MIPYLSLVAAKATLDAATDTFDYTSAAFEGWSIFNLPPRPARRIEDYLTTGIERIDELEMFADDRAVVEMCGQTGMPHHIHALLIDHAANSIRFHLWGPEWVDSRCGPTPEWCRVA